MRSCANVSFHVVEKIVSLTSLVPKNKKTTKFYAANAAQKTSMERLETWISRLNCLLARARDREKSTASSSTATACIGASPGTKAETARDGAAQREAVVPESASTANGQTRSTGVPAEATVGKDVQLLCRIHKEIAVAAISASSRTNTLYSTIQALSAELLSHFAKVRSIKLGQ